MQHPARAFMRHLFLLTIAIMLSLAPQPSFTLPNIVPPAPPDAAPFAHKIRITLPPGFQVGNAHPSQPTGSNSMMLDTDKIGQINININNNNNNNNNEPTASGGAGAGSGNASNGTGPADNVNNNNVNKASTSGSTINININNNNINNNNEAHKSATTPAPARARY